MNDEYNLVTDTEVTLSVVLGTASMPIEHLLKLGRGAIIELETPKDSDVLILANDNVFAKGQLQSQEDEDDFTLNVAIKKFSQ